MPRSKLIFVLGALEGLVFGYDTGVVAGALLFLRRDMGLTPALQGLVVSALLFGSIVAAPLSGVLSDRLGARRLIATAGILFFSGSLGAALAPSPAVLILFRFVLGLGVGIGTVQVPMYLAELSPVAIRGRLSSLFQLMVSSGIFLAYLCGFVFAGSGNWRLMFGIGTVPAVVLTFGVLLLPNSPRWLAKRGRTDEARAVLRATRPPAEAEVEFAEITSLIDRVNLSVRDLLRDPWLRRVLWLGVAMAFFQQALGINTIVYYTPTILHKVGFAPWAAILTGGSLQALSIIMTFVLGRIVDHAGRRILLMLGALIMAASMAALGLMFQFDLLFSTQGASAAVLCLAIFKATFSASWGPILWIVLPELLPIRARGAAMGACVLTTYTSNFVISSAFPVLLAYGPAGAFGTFAVAGVLAFVAIRQFLPETAGRSLEQIELAGRTQFSRAR